MIQTLWINKQFIRQPKQRWSTDVVERLTIKQQQFYKTSSLYLEDWSSFHSILTTFKIDTYILKKEETTFTSNGQNKNETTISPGIEVDRMKNPGKYKTLCFSFKKMFHQKPHLLLRQINTNPVKHTRLLWRPSDAHNVQKALTTSK